MTIYISGPITYATGPDQFGPLKERLEQMGYQTLNPKDVPACPDRSCARLPHEIEKDWEHSWACFLKYDLIAMLRYCDTIIMLDGWQDSHGARLEMSTAAALGFSILFAKDVLKKEKRATFTNSPPEPEPELHLTTISNHAGHWDASCTESRCSWSVVNIQDRLRVDELAGEHEMAAN